MDQWTTNYSSGTETNGRGPMYLPIFDSSTSRICSLYPGKVILVHHIHKLQIHNNIIMFDSGTGSGLILKPILTTYYHIYDC